MPNHYYFVDNFQHLPHTEIESTQDHTGNTVMYAVVSESDNIYWQLVKAVPVNFKTIPFNRSYEELIQMSDATDVLQAMLILCPKKAFKYVLRLIANDDFDYKNLRILRGECYRLANGHPELYIKYFLKVGDRNMGDAKFYELIVRKGIVSQIMNVFKSSTKPLLRSQLYFIGGYEPSKYGVLDNFYDRVKDIINTNPTDNNPIVRYMYKAIRCIDRVNNPEHYMDIVKVLDKMDIRLVAQFNRAAFNSLIKEINSNGDEHG